jgi:hypothetical protein
LVGERGFEPPTPWSRIGRKRNSAKTDSAKVEIKAVERML